MNLRLLILFIGVFLFNSPAGYGDEWNQKPLFVLSEKTALPPAFAPYQTAMVSLLREVSGKSPSKSNPMELVPEFTIKNFFEVIGRPLSGTRELTVYEISLRKPDVQGAAPACLVVRFVPGNTEGARFFDAAKGSVITGFERLKKTADKAIFDKWASGWVNGDQFMSATPCGVAVFAWREGEKPGWALAEKALHKEFRRSQIVEADR